MKALTAARPSYAVVVDMVYTICSTTTGAPVLLLLLIDSSCLYPLVRHVFGVSTSPAEKVFSLKNTKLQMIFRFRCNTHLRSTGLHTPLLCICNSFLHNDVTISLPSLLSTWLTVILHAHLCDELGSNIFALHP